MELVADVPMVSDDVKFEIPRLKLPVKVGKVTSETDQNAQKHEIASNLSEVIQNAVTAIGQCHAKLSIEVEFFE